MIKANAYDHHHSIVVVVSASLTRSFTIKHTVSLPLRRHSCTQSQLATSVKRHSDLIRTSLVEVSGLARARRRCTSTFLIVDITSKRYSVGARLSGRTTDGLYVLLCRYIRSQATHRYISRSAASYEEPISSYSLELK